MVEGEGKRLRDVVDELRGVYHRCGRPRGKREWIPEVPVPLGLECFGRGWWTMLGWEGAKPNVGVEADGGAKVDA